MYEEKFGFNKRPFRATPHGAEVFVGPQTAQTMQSLKKALTTSDGVVTVTGPAGSGKTTQVVRALEAIDSGCTCIRIGRMHLGPDEILEFLLAKLGVQSPPKSTIRRVVFFRAAVMQKRLAGHRVFIVVEDAQRLGLDALAELEALTGAENGDGDGANLILMAPQSLKPLLRSEGLERLDQRVRLRHQVKALNEAELCAYLKHCFRLAGAEFDLIFRDGAEKQLYAFSAGIPRVANNLVESVLTAAAEQATDKIGPELVSDIASAEYEMTVESRVPTFDTPAPPAAEEIPASEEPAVEPAPESVQTEISAIENDAVAEFEEVAVAPEVEAAAAEEVVTSEEAVAAPEAASEPEAVEATTIVNDEDVAEHLPEPPAPEPEAPVIAEPTPAEPPAVAATAVAEDEESDFEIPDLIQDTLPDLEILAPEVMEQNAISDAEMDAEEIPTLYSSMRMKAPLAEPAELSDDEDGKVFIGEDAEPVPVAEPAAEIAEPEIAPPEPAEAAAPEPVIAQSSPELPSSAPELPPVLEVEPPAAPAVEAAAAPAAPVAATPTAPAIEESPAAPDVLAAAQVEPAAADGELPAWERDPTLAQLKPDIEALENAMAEFADEPAPPVKEEEEEPLPEVELKDPTMPSLPEITLDAAIEEKIREAEEALEKHDATIAEDEDPALAVTDGERDTRADAELEKIAEGLARAKTIEDVDDRMAETLFGEEISMIAAQVAMAGPANEPAAESDVAPGSIPGDESIEFSPEPAAAEAPAEPESEFEREFREVYGENVDISLETKPKPGMDLSASQRLATVRALNAGIVQPPGPAPESAKPASPVEPPASIEDQIDTTLSQTIKTLNIDPSAMANDEDDEDDDGKRGFFSRFRRS